MIVYVGLLTVGIYIGVIYLRYVLHISILMRKFSHR